jgi:N-acetyl-D-muramate 6-phosphate phosphatase
MTRFVHLQAVLFDLDGTLIDSAPDLGHAADLMRVRRGLPSLPLERYRPMAGAGARGMIGVAFGFGTDHPDFEALRQEFFDNYQACMTERTRAFDDIEAMLGALESSGRPWGVVTNKSERFALPLTAAMPMFARAATVVAGDTTPHAKPHPAPLLEAARRLGLPPEACLYVGDDERDVQAGKAAGMPTVAACYGYLGVQADVSAWGADAVIENPRELLNFLGLA